MLSRLGLASLFPWLSCWRIEAQPNLLKKQYLSELNHGCKNGGEILEAVGYMQSSFVILTSYTFSCALPECWQRQSDCRIIYITWYKNVISVKRSKTCMCYIRSMHAVLTWLTVSNRSMAVSEVRISKAISYATKALGYSELRPNQELALKHFL